MKIYVVPENNTWQAKTKAWLKNRATDIQDFWNQNKGEIVVLAPLLIGAGVKISKSINKTVNLHQEEMLKDRRIYDPKLGHYWELNRKLDNSEYLELEFRKAQGESMGNILRSMGVLRY